MANPEHLAILAKGVDAWNAWHKTYKKLVDLRGADLHDCRFERIDFQETNLGHVNLSGSDLSASFLVHANLDSTLRQAQFTHQIGFDGEFHRGQLQALISTWVAVKKGFIGTPLRST